MRESHSMPRRAFTLVELLVVITIIGILIALLLPAVQAAREAARRATCINNLKQLALGLHNYEQANRQFPPGAIYVAGAAAPTTENGRDAGFGATWVTMLLPYIEQQSLHQQYNFSMPAYNGAAAANNPNHSVVSQILPALQCPTHPKITSSFNLTQNLGSTTAVAAAFAKGSYGASTGGGSLLLASDYNNKSRRGVFHPYQQYAANMAEITDGTSNVILLGEVIALNNTADGRGAWGYVAGPFFCGQSSCSGTRIFTPNASTCWDCAPFAANNLTSADINERDDPDATQNGGQGARSYHPGGVTFAMGDASVRFISSTVDQQAYLNAMAIADGQTTNLDR